MSKKQIKTTITQSLESYTTWKNEIKNYIENSMQKYKFPKDTLSATCNYTPTEQKFIRL